jgi:hypothetical protein
VTCPPFTCDEHPLRARCSLCPPQALLAKYGRRLFGVESRQPLDIFDVLGFSLSYELGGTNILEMLRQAGVPQTWEVHTCCAVCWLRLCADLRFCCILGHTRHHLCHCAELICKLNLPSPAEHLAASVFVRSSGAQRGSRAPLGSSHWLRASDLRRRTNRHLQSR